MGKTLLKTRSTHEIPTGLWGLLCQHWKPWVWAELRAGQTSIPPTVPPPWGSQPADSWLCVHILCCLHVKSGVGPHAYSPHQSNEAVMWTDRGITQHSVQTGHQCLEMEGPGKWVQHPGRGVFWIQSMLHWTVLVDTFGRNERRAVQPGAPTQPQPLAFHVNHY